MRACYRRWLWAFFFGFLLFAAAQPVGVLLSFPDELRVFPGQEVAFDSGPFFTLVPLPPARAADGDVLEEPLSQYEVELRLLGWLPLQRALVRVVPETSVIPGGQAVGILLSSQGLVVVRTAPVLLADGSHRSPAEEAGVRAGDIIVEAGGEPVSHPLELEQVVQSYGRQGRELPLLIRRGDKEVRVVVRPQLARDPERNRMRHMLGVYVKDPAAGVGTLTFWDPVSGRYGALGHMVAQGGEAPTLSDGLIVPALIHGINPSGRGRPGEKVGVFEPGEAMGTIEKNTPVGIFGKLMRPPEAVADPVPIALSHEIKEGKAEILTVLDGKHVEAFEVEVLAVHRQSRPGGKGLVIRVSDPRLIARTNGIVQGMSGSPILQDGKLIGAVTHVFINDPLRGYGVLAEWMAYEAGLGVADSAVPAKGLVIGGIFPVPGEALVGGAPLWIG